MHITKAEIEHAINLNDRQVFEAMFEGGYNESFWGVAFIGMSMSGQFIYSITYEDSETGDDATGRVYLKYARKPFTNTMYLVGEY